MMRFSCPENVVLCYQVHVLVDYGHPIHTEDKTTSLSIGSMAVSHHPDSRQAARFIGRLALLAGHQKTSQWVEDRSWR